jgi:hypothetical protein
MFVRPLICAALGSVLIGTPSFAGGFSTFNLQTAGKPYAYSATKAPDGSRAERFELRPGDCPKDTGDCGSDRERVEKSEQPPASKVGSEFWYHFSVYVPADWPSTGVLNTKLGQFHQKGDGKPPILFQLDDRAYVFELSNPAVVQRNKMAPEKPLAQLQIKTAAAMKGNWTNVLVHAKWSRGDDGFVKVWVDGNEMVDLKGANVDRNNPVYFKYGIYRSFVSRYKGQPYPTLVAWFKDINRGSARTAVEPK